MKRRILIADDEELERRALSHILGNSGLGEIEVLEASNGREALELAASGELDAALLDIRMPGIDGLDAAKSLHETRPELPIVFLTAYDSFEYARSALRLHVEDFLLKPATAEEVVAALRRAMERTRDRGADSLSPAARERLESAVSFLAQDIRDALAAGDYPAAAICRYLALAGAAGPVTAVAVLRAEAAMRPDTGGPSAGSLGGPAAPAADGAGPLAAEGAEARRRAMRGVAALAERLLSAGGRLALVGAGPERALCAVAARPAPAAAPAAPAVPQAVGDPYISEAEFRSALSDLARRTRAELGLTIAVGAAITTPRPGAEAAAALAAAGPDLAAAARRAAALAGSSRPLMVLPFSPYEKSGGADPSGRTASAPGQGSPRLGAGAEVPGHPANGAGALTARRALELMEARHAEELSLEIVAAELSVSASHLSRLLGRHAGLGFTDCLAKLRVEKAKAFLSSGTVSVKEAAGMVGFRDPAYFARVFRRFAGRSPTEYRAEAVRAGSISERDAGPAAEAEGGR